MLYFHNITSKISRLAQDVSTVYEVDMNTQIRTGKGNDELSGLTRNVERMRSTMLESLENEKAALNANSELITSMSHDIRTPLTVLLGYIDIMKTRECDDVMKEYLRASESTAMRLKELSDDLFRYFLVFGGDLTPELADYDVKTLMDQLLTEHILLLGERGYKVSLHTSKSLCEGLAVTTDAPKLMRVVDNLFSNIYKYADIERPITVAAGMTAAGKVRVAIKNFVGEGTDIKESNRIGLKTCKKLCDALGAGFEYTVDTRKGADTFTAIIDLPVAREVSEL
jgi:signal transduction histidine kinase